MKHSARSAGTRLALAMLTAGTLGLGAAPAHAQFGNMLKNMVPGMPAAGTTPAAPSTPAATNKASTGKAATPQESGAMGLQAPTALPPLHKLGTDAVAVVETAAGTTAVRPMDYVFAKQTIGLGAAGKITMSYLSGCLTETIQGGTVTVALGGSKVAGGKVLPKTTPGCKAAKPVVLASASEAGATVNRITPFSDGNWNERALKTGQPVFKWDQALGAVTIRVKDMDKEGEPVVWEATPTADWIAYPVKGGARLAPGEPFKAEAVSGGKVVASALFSVDPAIDVPDTMANRLVPLTKP